MHEVCAAPVFYGQKIPLKSFYKLFRIIYMWFRVDTVRSWYNSKANKRERKWNLEIKNKTYHSIHYR